MCHFLICFLCLDGNSTLLFLPPCRVHVASVEAYPLEPWNHKPKSILSIGLPRSWGFVAATEQYQRQRHAHCKEYCLSYGQWPIRKQDTVYMLRVCRFLRAPDYSSHPPWKCASSVSKPHQQAPSASSLEHIGQWHKGTSRKRCVYKNLITLSRINAHCTHIYVKIWLQCHFLQEAFPGQCLKPSVSPFFPKPGCRCLNTNHKVILSIHLLLFSLPNQKL